MRSPWRRSGTFGLVGVVVVAAAVAVIATQSEGEAPAVGRRWTGDWLLDLRLAEPLADAAR